MTQLDKDILAVIGVVTTGVLAVAALCIGIIMMII